MQPISRQALLPPHLLDSVTRRFGAPVVASLPPVNPHDDLTDAVTDLHDRVKDAAIVLFPDIWPGDLDSFFRLRLLQVLDGQAALPGLSVVILSAVMAGQPLAAGFADRFRSAWPFARCVFLTEADDHPTLSALIGLPVAPLDQPATADPPILTSGATAGQVIAVQLQPIWGRCGSSIVFENQVESLVHAGLLTIRVFADAQVRHGATLWSRLGHVIAENGVRAGAHIDILAVPDGAPFRLPTADVGTVWRDMLTASATVRMRDRTVTRAVAKAECVIANRLECLGPALTFAPGARLLLSLQEDRGAIIHQSSISRGYDKAVATLFGTTATRVQAQMLAIADICGFASQAETAHLAPQCRRAVTIPPDATATPVPENAVPHFDLLLTAAEDAMNVASLRWFLEQVWRPHLEALGISVAIAGRAGPHVRDTARGSPLVHIMGFVEDLDTIRTWCRLTVVADLAWAGVSAKLLTALAAGHPLATTRAGLRGLDPSAAAMLPAYDDAAALAADIRDLVGSPDRLAERRQAVRRLRDATSRASDYAAAAMSVPRPSGPAVRKRLERWSRLLGPTPPTEAAPYRFQLEVAFPVSEGARGAEVLLAGWHDPEPWGRWTDGADASLRITLGEPAGEPLTLELVIVPSASGANLRIGWDGTMLPLIDPVPGANLWDIPPELTTGKSSFLVSLHAGDTTRPAAAGDSVDDRILGIGVTSVRLLSRQPTLCEPGVPMPVRADAMPRQVLLAGWHGPEPWGCWSRRTTAALRLTLQQPVPDSIRLELDLLPQSANPPLTLSVNGAALPAVIPVNGRNTWDLPPRTTTGRTELQLLLSVPETFCAARAGTGADDRELGIGLRRITLIPFVPVYHEPGIVLRLARPDPLDEILRTGWHTPEEWGCWTSGR
ncbi:MAG TPA: glycosyltransferase, partial [Rhodopila sp.]|nr:glycosyltransferase [Rhodopila sp.]